jgi:predicted transglutaminase-like cysteine proteinase
MESCPLSLKRKFFAFLAWHCVLIGSALASEYVLPPIQHTMFCQRYPAECFPGPQPTISLSGPARIRQLQKVNASVNNAILSIRLPPSALNQWTIFPRAGLCGDYAVTKRHVLQSSGWPSSDLLLAEVALRRTGERHLILIARTEGGSWVLDNLSETVTSIETASRNYWFLRIASSGEPLYWKRFSAATKRL